MLQNKQNKLRRRAVRLLLFIAALFALSPTAGAWGDAYFKLWYNSNNILDQKVSTSDGNYFTYTYTADNTGDHYFQLWDGEHSVNVGSSSDNNSLTFNNNVAEEDNCCADNDGSKVKSFKIYLTSGEKYKIEYWNSYGSNRRIVVTHEVASTIPSSLYFRTDHNSWGTPISMTKSSDGKKFSHTIDPYTANSTVKFHFRQNQNDWNGYKLFPNSDGASVSVGSNTIDNYTTDGSDPNKAWAFKSTSGQPVTFTVDFSNASKPVLKITQDSGTTYYLKGLGDWGTQGRAFSGSGNTLTLDVDSWDSSWDFKVFDGSSYFGPGEVTLDSGKSEDVSSDISGNMTLASGASGKNVSFTLTLNNGKPSTLKATWDEGGSGGDDVVTTDKVKIIGDFTLAGYGIDWSDGTNTVPAGNNEYTYTFTPTKEDGDKVVYFRVKIDGTEYGPNWSENIDAPSDPSWNQAKVQTNPGNLCWKNGFSKDKTYTIKVTLNYNNNAGDHRVTMYEGKPNVWEARALPCFPQGITNETQLAASEYASEPLYYLQSMVLNDNQITPEYQMIKQTDGTYTLEFTYRNTKTQDESKSAETEQYIWVEGFENYNAMSKQYGKQASNDLKDSKTFKEGMRYKATFAPSTGTLTLTSLDVRMPFISMIGAEWTQRVKESTPDADRTTDMGWQEAWIQYGSDKQPLKDRSGKVMYNTMWPPLHEIFFQSKFTDKNKKEHDITLGSNQLVFKRGETKTGKEWKADSRFSAYEKGDLDYTTAFDANNAKTKQYKDKLVLDDSKTYTVYTVDDMWINGKVKMWTGWGGCTFNDKTANWTWHSNWGHFGKSEDPVQIDVESTVPLFNEHGDINYEYPTYLKKVYFFYENEDPSAYRHSVFFSELATGGAQIMAEARDNFTYGKFEPQLTDYDNISDRPLKSITVTSYASDDTEYKNPLFVVYNQSFEDKKVTDWASCFTYDEDTWVYDTKVYANGNYKYKMVVTYNDANKGDQPIEVVSNPFTIFRGEASATLKAYQLVKVLNPTDGYNYLTYDPAGGDKVYKVKVTVEYPNNVIGGVNSTSDEKALDSDINPKYVESKELTTDEITALNFGDGSKYRFSCKVLLVGDILGQNITSYELLEPQLVDIENYIVGDRVEKDNVPTFTMDKEGRKDRFFYIVEPLIKDNGFGYSYTWKPDFKYSFEDAQGTTQTKEGNSEASVEGCLVLPEPKLIEEHSRLEMFYGGSESETTDDDIRNFSYTVGGDNAVELGAGARFQQVRKAIVIERPNVTLRYRALSKEYIVAKAKAAGIDVGYTEDTKAPLVVGLFDFKVGNETVVINNGSKYPNSEGLDWYLYHSATKNPADYYFKGFDGFEYGWDPEGNIGVTTYYVPREMTFSVRDAFKDVKFFPRWKDGMISGLRISQDAPVNALAEGTYKDAIGSSDGDNAVRITRSSLIYAEADAGDIKKGDLIEQVTVKVNLASETGNVVARVDEEGNPLKETGEVAEDYREAGKEMQHTDFITTGNDAQAAADTESDEKGTTDYFLVRIVDKTTQKDLMTPQAVSAKDMYDGKEFAVTANHGHWWDGQLETVKSDALYKRMQVRISHLYPFVAGTKGTTVDTTTPASAPRRAAAEDASDENVVIKSDAMLREFAGSDIPTAVIGVEDAMRDSVVAGMGFIEAHGEGVEIYGADGIRIAAGEGRHEVPAGVYVVRLNGRAEKVIVR